MIELYINNPKNIRIAPLDPDKNNAIIIIIDKYKKFIKLL